MKFDYRYILSLLGVILFLLGVIGIVIWLSEISARQIAESNIEFDLKYGSICEENNLTYPYYNVSSTHYPRCYELDGRIIKNSYLIREQRDGGYYLRLEK